MQSVWRGPYTSIMSRQIAVSAVIKPQSNIKTYIIRDLSPIKCIFYWTNRTPVGKPQYASYGVTIQPVLPPFLCSWSHFADSGCSRMYNNNVQSTLVLVIRLIDCIEHAFMSYVCFSLHSYSSPSTLLYVLSFLSPLTGRLIQIDIRRIWFRRTLRKCVYGKPNQLPLRKRLLSSFIGKGRQTTIVSL